MTGPLPLTPREVLVIGASLDVDPPRLARLGSLLAGDEQARAERFVFDVHRRRFTAARGLLRETLGSLLGEDGARVGFEYGAHGKPCLRGAAATALRFNLSHAGDRALIALARDRELGVDLEAVRLGIDHAAIAARFFAPGEQRALAALPEAEQAAGFFTIWTRKEACVKLLGGGLQIDLGSFEVSLDEPARLAGLAAGVHLRALPAPPGWKAALAHDGGVADVRFVDGG